MDEQRLGVAKLTKIIKDIEAGCWRYSYFARLALDLRDARSRIATLKRDLAAAQAEVVELRDVLATWLSWRNDEGSNIAAFAECKHEFRMSEHALSRPPGSLSALEAWGVKVAMEAEQDADLNPAQWMAGRKRRAEELVSRILGKEAARG